MGIGPARVNCNFNLNDYVEPVLRPRHNAERLQTEVSELKSRIETTKKQILELQGAPGKRVRVDVKNWVQEADQVVEEVSRLLNKRLDRWFTLNRFFCCICQNYSHGEDINNKLEKVKQLNEQHRSWNGQLQIDIRLSKSVVVALRKELQQLSDLKTDLKKKIAGLMMEQPVEPSQSVLRWNEEMDELEVEAREVIEGNIEVMDTISRIRGRVDELKRQHADLERLGLVVQEEPKRVEDILWHSPPPVVADMVNIMVDVILDCLERDEGQLLGIHGAGGVGKSTLVWELNRRLEQSQSPDLVICVEVKSGADIFRIQEDVGRRLGYRRSGEAGPHLPADERDRAELLRRRISEKKCLLILDDVCESIDLRRIGVPRESGNRCKVVLTTRDERVCDYMGVNWDLQLDPLNEEDSWALFRGTFPRNDLLENVSFRLCADEVVRMCGGIPRVIETVARAMSTRESLLEWKVAPGVVNALSAEIGDSRASLNHLSSRFSKELDRRAAEAADAAARARSATEAALYLSVMLLLQTYLVHILFAKPAFLPGILLFGFYTGMLMRLSAAPWAHHRLEVRGGVRREGWRQCYYLMEGWGIVGAEYISALASFCKFNRRL